MRKLIKIHFRYFVDKFSVILIGSLFLIGVLFFMILGLKLPKINFVENYCQLSYSIIKFIGVIFSINIFVFSGLPKNDSYVNVWVTSKSERSKYIISKILVYSLIVIGFIFLMFETFLVMGLLFNKYFYFYDFKNILIVCVVAVYYGILSNILIKILPNYLISFVVIILFMLGDFLSNLMSNDSFLLTAYSLLFPVITNFNNEFRLKGGVGSFLMLPLVLSLMYQLYMRKDL